MESNFEVSGKEIEKTETRKSRERDYLFSWILILGSLALIVYANLISFRAMQLMGASYYTAPGFAIMFISIGLLVMGIYLMLVSRKRGATLTWLLPGRLVKRLKEDQFDKTLLIFSYLGLYMVVFFDRIPFTRIRVPFWLSTFVFLYVTLRSFKAAGHKASLAISILTAGLVYYIFRYLIGVPLP
jgi:hypothetical protein